MENVPLLSLTDACMCLARGNKQGG